MARSLQLDPQVEMPHALAGLFLVLVAQGQGPGLTVSLGTRPDQVFSSGDPVRVRVRTNDGSYLTVFRIDTEGWLSVLHPPHPWQENYVVGRRTYELTPAGGKYAFLADPLPGIGYVLALVSAEQFDYRRLVRAERWDLSALGRQGRITGDPRSAIDLLVQTIVPGAVAQSGLVVVPYSVAGQYEYPRFLCYECHSPATYPSWSPYQEVCPRFVVVRVSDPKTGYRYSLRDRHAAGGDSQPWLERSTWDWLRLVPRVLGPRRADELSQPPAARAPWPPSVWRRLSPRLERRPPSVQLQRPDSPQTDPAAARRPRQ